MIDTDKYEGHHKAWVNEYGDVVKLVYPNEESPSLDADQHLITDAPLLLAEVKELRRQIKVAQGVFEHLYDDELEDASWIRWFCNMEDEEE
jgi:hypothetical protein